MYTKAKNFIFEKYNKLFVDSKRKTLNFFVFTLILLAISRIGMLVLFLLKYGNTEQFIELMSASYDSGWYRSIITEGYKPEPNEHPNGDASSWAFFPLSPLLVRIFSFNCFLDCRIIGMMLNTVLFALAITVTFKYAETLGTSGKIVFPFTFFMIFGPYSFYFSTLYTESLFMLLTMLYLYFLKKENYIFMGIFGALLSATRVTGVFMVFATLIYVIVKHIKEKNGNLKKFIVNTLNDHKLLLGVCLVPLGLFCYMLYLKNLTGDAFAFMHIQKAWGRTPLINLGEGFIGALRHYFSHAATNDMLVNIHYLLVLAAIIFTFIYIVKKKPHETIPYFFPVIINLFTLGLTNTARYSIGTGIFVFHFFEMLSTKPKWIRITIYIAIMVCSYYMQLAWYERHFITIG